MQRFSEKHRPCKLHEIVGQPAVVRLRVFLAKPYSCCFMLEGPPGVGKTTAAHALPHELGCDELFDTHHVCGPNLDIDRARELMQTLNMRPVGGQWQVLVIEEFEAACSPSVSRYLKDALEKSLPKHAIVIATSNNGAKIEKALRQRFRWLQFSNGPDFVLAAQAYLGGVWRSEAGPEHPYPREGARWGFDGDGEFSLRLALDEMQDYLDVWRVAQHGKSGAA